jgi:hypothetical protein
VSFPAWVALVLGVGLVVPAAVAAWITTKSLFLTGVALLMAGGFTGLWVLGAYFVNPG